MSTFTESVADRLAIRELIDAYVMSVDSHDNDAFADNFWDDGVYISPFGSAEGREAIVATIAQWHGGGITAGKRHMVGPSAIQLDGDRATGTAAYFIVEAALSPPAIVASGGYKDIFEKRGGTWRLLRREQTIDPSFQMPS
jgi:uncharacterized protein (TIGR02246 family)